MFEWRRVTAGITLCSGPWQASNQVRQSVVSQSGDGFVVNMDTNVRFVKIYKIKIWTC